MVIQMENAPGHAWWVNKRLMEKKILYVNWGTKDKRYTFEAAKKKGLKIYLATNAGYPDWIKDFVSIERIIITNTYDKCLLIKDVDEYLRKKKIVFDGVVTFFEMNIIQTAELAKYLGCKFISPKAANHSSANKYLMRSVCRDAGIITPKFELFENVIDGIKKISKFKGAVVIKPIMSGHSYGVIKVNNRYDFIGNYIKACKQMKHCFDEWMKYYGIFYDKKFLMEEYIEGMMVSVDGLIQDGDEKFLSVTEFEMGEEPLFLQRATYIPATFDSEIQEVCKNEARKIYKVLGFDNCGIHCEMRVKNGKAILIEIAARLPGGQILNAYREAFGIDLASLYLDICMGKRIDKVVSTNKFWVLQESIPFNKEGVVTELSFKKKLEKSIKFFSISEKSQRIKSEGGVYPPVVYYQVKSESVDRLKIIRRKVLINLKISVRKNWVYWYLLLMDVIYISTPKCVRKLILGRGYIRKLFIFLNKTNCIVEGGKREF